MEKERGRVWISLNHPVTNFKKWYTEKASGCGTVKWFTRLGLDPHQGIHWAPYDHSCKGNSVMQIVCPFHSQTLSLTPKIEHRKKRKLDSDPRYGPANAKTPILNLRTNWKIMLEFEFHCWKLKEFT